LVHPPSGAISHPKGKRVPFSASFSTADSSTYPGTHPVPHCVSHYYSVARPLPRGGAVRGFPFIEFETKRLFSNSPVLLESLYGMVVSKLKIE